MTANAEKATVRQHLEYGTDAFITQAIDVAARKNMQIEFVDPAQNDKLEALKKQARVGMEHIKRHQDQNSSSPAKEVETHEKTAEVEEVRTPGKLAARQQQQNRAQRVHTANEEQRKKKSATKAWKDRNSRLVSGDWPLPGSHCTKENT